MKFRNSSAPSPEMRAAGETGFQSNSKASPTGLLLAVPTPFAPEDATKGIKRFQNTLREAAPDIFTDEVLSTLFRTKR